MAYIRGANVNINSGVLSGCFAYHDKIIIYCMYNMSLTPPESNVEAFKENDAYFAKQEFSSEKNVHSLALDQFKDAIYDYTIWMNLIFIKLPSKLLPLNNIYAFTIRLLAIVSLITTFIPLFLLIIARNNSVWMPTIAFFMLIISWVIHTIFGIAVFIIILFGNKYLGGYPGEAFYIMWVSNVLLITGIWLIWVGYKRIFLTHKKVSTIIN